METLRSNAARAAAVLLVVLVAGVFGVMFMGTQVSQVLSTVGSSVGIPDAGEVGQNDGAGDAPAGNGQPDGGDAGSGGQSDAGSGDQAFDPNVTLTSLDRPDLLVIKAGTLSLRVAAIEPALDASTKIVRSLGGYAAGSDRGGDPDVPHASVTFRVPAAGWEEAMSRLRGLAQEVLEEHSSTEDVTGKVVDLGARIRNLQATERALQQIMDRATVIKDVLSVQGELTTVRGQIEELSAEKAHLEDQAAYSTLEVSFSLKAPDPIKVEQAGFDPSGEVDRASASLVGILQDLAVVGIWFGIVWLPILVALVIVLGTGWFVASRFRGQGPRGGPPDDPDDPYEPDEPLASGPMPAPNAPDPLPQA